MYEYNCPGCGDTDETNLVPIKGSFYISSDHITEDREIKIYACKKCSCLQVNNYHFDHKQIPTVKE